MNIEKYKESDEISVFNSASMEKSTAARDCPKLECSMPGWRLSWIVDEKRQ